MRNLCNSSITVLNGFVRPVTEKGFKLWEGAVCVEAAVVFNPVTSEWKRTCLVCKGAERFCLSDYLSVVNRL